jgi:hypothetical protein
MIVFRCPECREEMEIPVRMAGRFVSCVECGQRVRVPQEGGRRRPDDDEGLTGSERLGYTLLFLFVPCVNVIASSVLYYVWRPTRPRAAGQINLLGFLIFAFHVVAFITYAVVMNNLVRH